MGMYHLGLFILRKRDVAAICFASVCFLVAIRVGVTSERVVCMLTTDFSTIIRLEYLSFFSTMSVLFMFFRRLFPDEFPLPLSQVIAGVSLAFNLSLFAPSTVFTYLVIPFQFFILIVSFLISYYIAKALVHRRSGARILCVAWLVLFAAIANDILHVDYLYYSDHYIYVGVLIFVLIQSFLLSQRFAEAFKLSEQLAVKLDYTNTNLEMLINERTRKIEEQYDELEMQNLKIKDFNTRLTDSINYAQRIQSALLPSEQLLHEVFPQSFSIFIPKDIVSGDFYWLKSSGQLVYLALADCTGHGVPGSLMSMLGISLLNESLVHNENASPAFLLEMMRDNIKQLFHQTGEFGEMNDGMDMAICLFDKSKKQLQFAGAHNPIYIIRSGDSGYPSSASNQEVELIELKPNSMPVGIYPNEQPFVNHFFDLKANDHLYLFSDGFADQFGGTSNRKYTTRRFKEFLTKIQGQEMREQERTIMNEFDEWRGEAEQVDDVSVLGIKICRQFLS